MSSAARALVTQASQPSQTLHSNLAAAARAAMARTGCRLGALLALEVSVILSRSMKRKTHETELHCDACAVLCNAHREWPDLRSLSAVAARTHLACMYVTSCESGLYHQQRPGRCCLPRGLHRGLHRRRTLAISYTCFKLTAPTNSSPGFFAPSTTPAAASRK